MDTRDHVGEATFTEDDGEVSPTTPTYLSDQDAKIDELFDYEEPGYATVIKPGVIAIPTDDETPGTILLRNDVLPSPPPTPLTPPESPTTSIPIDAEVCVEVVDDLNISSDAEDAGLQGNVDVVAQHDLPDELDGTMEDKVQDMDSKSEISQRARSHSAESGKSGVTVNEKTGSYHYKTGWIASANVKVRKTLRRLYRPLRRQDSSQSGITQNSVRSVDDYQRQRELTDDVFDNNTPASKQHAMMSSWVLFRKKLNSELIRKLMDPVRVGRSEPTRVYTIDQGTSKFAIFNAKRDRSLQHARALYLDPETYVSMGIPRVRLASVRETARRLSQNAAEDNKTNGDLLTRRISTGEGSDYYIRDEFKKFSLRGEIPKGAAVQTFRSTRSPSEHSKEDETRRSTESIQITVDFT